MLGFLGLASLDELFDAVPAALRLAGGLDLARRDQPEPDVLARARAPGRRQPGPADRLVCFAGAGAYDHEVPPVVRALAGRSRVRDRLHAVPARGGPGRPAGGLRVPDDGGPPGRAAGRQRLPLRRRQRAGRGGQPRRRRRPGARRSGSRPASTRTGGRCSPPSPPGPATSSSRCRSRDGRTRLARRAGRGDAAGRAWSSATRTTSAASRTWPRPGAAADDARGAARGGRRPGGGRPAARRRASWGADVVVGEGQAFGTPLGFGGPYLGLFACTLDHVRRLPGRLVGETVDAEGRRAYVTTLRAREQDIRREKATSNVCTNQTLMAVTAAVQLGWLGTAGPGRGGAALRPGHPLLPRRRCSPSTASSRSPATTPVAAGVRRAHRRCRRRGGRRAAGRRGVPGRGGPRPTGGRGRRRLGRRRRGRHGLLVAVTERRTRAEIDALRGRLRQGGAVDDRAAGRRRPGRRAPRCSGRDTEPTLFELSPPGPAQPGSCGRPACPSGRVEELVPAEHRRADAGRRWPRSPSATWSATSPGSATASTRSTSAPTRSARAP